MVKKMVIVCAYAVAVMVLSHQSAFVKSFEDSARTRIDADSSFELGLNYQDESQCWLCSDGRREEYKQKAYLAFTKSAVLYLRLGNDTSALAAYEHIISMGDTSIATRDIYNNLLCLSGNPIKARVKALETISQDPGNSRLWMSYAVMSRYCDDIPSAIHASIVAINYDPYNIYPREFLISLLEEIGWISEAMLQKSQLQEVIAIQDAIDLSELMGKTFCMCPVVSK